MDVENLISEVFERPALWDKKSKNHHNRILVEKKWTEIEKILKISKGDLKKKWKNLRDQFRSEWKKIPASKSGDYGVSEEAYSNYTSWPYFKSLLFLKDQIKPRKSVGEDVLCLSEDEPPKKKEKKFNTSEELVAVEPPKLMLLDKKINNKKEKDDDECFFASLIPYMRKMDPMKKLLCRIEIQKTILNFSFDNSSDSDISIS